jgi:hypothetical protein
VRYRSDDFRWAGQDPALSMAGLLAELPADRPCWEHVAVNVHVVVVRILPDGLDQLRAYAQDAGARTVGAREGTGEQWDDDRPGNPGGSNMDVRRSHSAIDPSPVEIEADLTQALVECNERRSRGVRIARPRYLRRPCERRRERAAFPEGGSGDGEHADRPENGGKDENATLHGYLPVR